MSEFFEKVKVVLTAVPTWGAAAVAVLTAFATSVVPLLPVDVGVKVGAAVASLVAGITTVVSVISRVTPVAPEEEGLLPVEPVVVPPYVDESGVEPANTEFWGDGV